MGRGRTLLFKNLIWYILTATFCAGRVLDNRGRAFLLTFIENFGDNTQFRLVITSQSDATIYVNNPNARAAQQELSVQADGSVHVPLGDVAIKSEQVAEKKAIMVFASSPVAVFAFSTEYRSSGGYLALPVDGLGMYYVVATFDGTLTRGGGRIAIAAVQDYTDVMVIILVRTTTICGSRILKRDDTATFRFKLQAQEVMQIFCDSDITGSKVQSNRPVAVVAGTKCAHVPSNRPFCDHLTEMLIPVASLGKRYLLHPFAGRDNGAIFRIMPSEPDTIITSGQDLSQDIKNISFLQERLFQADRMVVTADKPILVTAYALGQGTNSSLYPGDPVMTQLPSPELAPNEYLLDLSLATPGSSCHVTAVAREEYAEGIMVGNKVMITEFVDDKLYIGTEPVTQWPTRVYHTNPDAQFALLAYCFNDGEGFAFPAGLILQDETGKDECAGSPCENSGICYEVGYSYHCKCVDVFGGPTCQIDTVDDCQSSPCAVGATCVDGVKSFTCLCPPERTGDTCQLEIVESTTSEDTTTPETTTLEETTLPESTTEPPETTEPLEMTPGLPKPTDVPYEVVPPPPARLCPCPCGFVPPSVKGEKNETAEEKVEEEILKIKEELAMNVKNTSKARSHHQTIYDSRTSAASIGILGVSLFAFIIGFIIIMDMSSLINFIVEKIRSRQKTSLNIKQGKPKEGCQSSSTDHAGVTAVTSLGSQGSNEGDLTQVEVNRFVEAVAMGDGNSTEDHLPRHRGSRRKHLLHVRPETILLHVHGNKKDRQQLTK